MWIEATKQLPDDPEDLRKNHRVYGEEVFCLVDGVAGIGHFMRHGSAWFFSYVTLRINKQLINEDDFDKLKWMHIPKP